MKKEQTMHKIGILSDTHNLLRPSVADILRTCDIILHAGDLHTRKIFDELSAIAPVYAVRGRSDYLRPLSQIRTADNEQTDLAKSRQLRSQTLFSAGHHGSAYSTANR